MSKLFGTLVLAVSLIEFFEKVNFEKKSADSKKACTLIVFLKFFFEKVNFEKNQQTAKKDAKLPSELN